MKPIYVTDIITGETANVTMLGDRHREECVVNSILPGTIYWLNFYEEYVKGNAFIKDGQGYTISIDGEGMDIAPPSGFCSGTDETCRVYHNGTAPEYLLETLNIKQ